VAEQLHRIVVVGGGAGGLELATRLGNRLGRRRKAHITLIDKRRTHVWKPLLHEIAAGSMDLSMQELDYLAQAHWHGFTFRLGGLIGIDRARRTVRVSRYLDEEGREVLPEREFGYDTLVIAIGSLTNDFGTRGVKTHAIPLDTTDQAERFHTRLVNACLRANTQSGPLLPGQLHVAIIGGGATGTELAAELHKTTRQLVAFGLDRIDPDKDIKIHLIEAAPRILPALPERLSEGAARLLAKLKVQVHTGALVTEVTSSGVTLANGTTIAAELVVWAAGIKAPDLLKDIAGLETDKLNRLVVRLTLQTTRDDAIFAFGDCAACPWPGHKGPEGGAEGGRRESTVPPRAQAAHQQASHLARQLPRRIAGMSLREWRYRDFGSLVSLGEYTTVGNLMGKLVGGSLFIEGWFAGVMYRSLYKMHQLALHGPAKVVLDTIARVITRRTEPVVKLH
jgi:NADH dehydrogenase